MTENPTLRGLLDDAAHRHGTTSGRRLAEIATEHGLAISHATVNQIRSGTHRGRPGEGTVRAVAWLAGVPQEVAFAAAGLPAPGTPFADELPEGVDALSPRSRRAVIELIRVLVDQERAATAAPARARTPRRDEMTLAARPGAPAHAPDGTTGESSQEPDGEWEPA